MNEIWAQFAAAALQGIAAGEHVMPDEKQAARAAKLAAEYADAMLQEYAKREEKSGAYNGIHY